MPSTKRWGLPYPAPRTKPATRVFLTNLAEGVETALSLVRDGLGEALTNLDRKTATADEDAKQVNVYTEGASGGVTVQTVQQDVPGAVHRLPANVGALVIATCDVQCDVWNGLCTFAGRLRIFRLSDSAELDLLSGQATYSAGVVHGRATVAQTWRIGPADVGRGLQLAVVKSAPSNAGYVVNQTTTKLSVVRSRTGANPGGL